MELSLALQASQRLITAWQTPLLFVVVQVLIVLIFFKDFSCAAGEGGQGPQEQEEEEAADSDFWSSVYMPSQLSRLPSFSGGVALPSAVVVGLRNWARRSSCHVKSTATAESS